MSRWRILVVVFLITVPFLVLAGVGTYYLWRVDLWLFVWWPLAALMIAGYVLAWHWQRKNRLLRPFDFTPRLEWTERDHGAWKLVQARAESAVKLDVNRLSSLAFFTDTAQEMAVELARFYHPRSTDPISALTVPEVLAVVELASRDLAEMVDQYLPGGHLLTIRDWQRAKQLSDWYPTASNLYWLVSGIFSPVNTAARYLTSQVGMARPFQRFQENLIAWFATAYIHRVGTYLIDVNSGRLRVGARRFRELRGAWLSNADTARAPTDTTGNAPGELTAAPHVGLAVVGQVKAGKSSLINALLGERRAGTDALPLTSGVTRYSLSSPGADTRLELYDTVGYGHEGPREDQISATRELAQQSDLILFVSHARNPARHADLSMLRALHTWFDGHPALRRPPILGVITHIDLLSPAMEWDPPYDWLHPKRPKEKSIHDAREALGEQVGEFLVGIVPVCAAAGKEYGIQDKLLPTIVDLLDQARAVAFLRCLHAEANTGKVRKIWQQLFELGTLAAKEVLIRPPGRS
jgi:predicted GTPase